MKKQLSLFLYNLVSSFLTYLKNKNFLNGNGKCNILFVLLTGCRKLCWQIYCKFELKKIMGDIVAATLKETNQELFLTVFDG